MNPKKILFLSSNPLTSGRLRVDEEMREIRETLQKAGKREQFAIESVPAVRYRDLNSEVLRIKPNIVHFSGHGIGAELKEGEDPNSRKLVLDAMQSDNGGLIVEGESGQVQIVDTKPLAKLFKLFADTVECVVLNACFSHVQAEAIAEYIPYVVGMGKAIGDKAAIEFAIAFYEALGEGRGYEFAFEFACTAIDLAGIPESDTPKLFKKELRIPLSRDNKASQSEYKQIIRELITGNIVPFLGSGINPDFYIQLASSLVKGIREDLNGNIFSEENLVPKLIGIPCQICPYLPEERPPQCPMLKGIGTATSCPLYTEQTLAIASMNLRYLSQYYALKYSVNVLYAKLRRILKEIENNNPNRVHQLFAELPGKLSKYSPRLPLIVTTNYDDLLERAFDNAKQPYDIVYYVVDGERGKYKHKRYGEDEAHTIEDREYLGLPLPSSGKSPSQTYPIILKLYGTWTEQFVITQDHLNLFASNWIDNLPTALVGVLNQAGSILFLGYSPSDSELQLIVNQFWSKNSERQTERLPKNSCLVHQSNPGELGTKIWQEQRGVKLLSFDSSLSLEDFAISFEREIEEEIKKW